MARTGTFDFVAPIYDALAFVVFGRRLQQAQTVCLDQMPAGASVLIVGGGTGELLGHVLNRCRPQRVLYLEASAKMLARASRRMIRSGSTGTVEFRLGTEADLRPDECFDVLMTPFVLDVFTETTLTSRVIPRLRAALEPGGQWYVTDFVRTTVWWQRALLWTMIRFFRLTAGIEAGQLTDWPRALTNAGLTLTYEQPQVWGMVSAQTYQVSKT